jgi:hypothetical protein
LKTVGSVRFQCRKFVPEPLDAQRSRRVLITRQENDRVVFQVGSGNGGMLYATAMMAAGWDSAPAGKHAPGFPDDGNWVVKWEGLHKAP